MSKGIVQKLEENSKISDNLSIKWTEIESEDEVREKMDNQEYYGALIIPENFTKNIASLSTQNPTISEFNIIINQGKNAQVSTQVTQLLTNIVNNSGQGISSQVVAKAQATNTSLPAKTVETLLHPVKVNIETVHTYGDLANGGAMFFQPIWMASMMIAMLLFTDERKLTLGSTKAKFNNKILRLLYIALASLAAGFTAPWLIENILSVNIDNYQTVAWFLSICTFTFASLILGFTNWLGFIGLPVFGLLLFFGGPLLQLAPEMIGDFYTKWVMPILPMKGLYEGIRSILFYGQGVWNNSTKELLIFATVGIALVITSVFKKDKVKKEN